MLDFLEGLPVFQIWCECRQRYGDTNLATKKLTSEFFVFRLRRLKTLVLKNQFVREVGCFLRAGHIYCICSLIFKWRIEADFLYVFVCFCAFVFAIFGNGHYVKMT